ncbi:MAG: sigma-70 family RNA polymerase sigma factor [Planctomycetes bacterium]|nr:sigma-70 family RNA polymerase sigma factor [Planctomycetota bacterium]
MADQADFLRLFMAHQGEIRTFVRALVSDPNDVDDVCQDIATILWKKFDQYDPSRRFGAWARGVAVHEIDYFRRKSRRRPIPFSIETIEAIRGEFDRREPQPTSRLMQFVEDCLRRLTARARQMFALRYEQGQSVAEIARELSSAEPAIYKALGRYRQQLRECVEQKAAREQEAPG